jgi:holo-[acyl-carrier protein] synthase
VDNLQRNGVDIVEIGRIEQAIERWGDHFRNRIFTPAELALYKQKVQSLAARFAAKEAVSKVLGKPPGISWQHVEILSDDSGQPVIRLYGVALEQAKRLGLTRVAVSLSHSREYAIAFVSGQAKK